MTRLCVLGFGLIGGSLALAARARGFASHVTAIDRADVLALVQARGAADRVVDSSDADATARALAESDLTVLAAPVSVIAERVEWALAHGKVVTDCGSTKRLIVERARRSARSAWFVPGHPMAGLPHGGLSSARPDLFEQSAWLLCPAQSEPEANALVERLVLSVGARPIRVSPKEHDAAVARTSHLPQILASALRVLAAKHAESGAAGPAFERATRTAGGPEPIWRDIFASNADEVARAIRELCAELEPIAAELEGGSQRAAEALLERARRTRSTR